MVSRKRIFLFPGITATPYAAIATDREETVRAVLDRPDETASTPPR
jgi:hypothetical protein